jgi:hypothetical protein
MNTIPMIFPMLIIFCAKFHYSLESDYGLLTKSVLNEWFKDDLKTLGKLFLSRREINHIANLTFEELRSVKELYFSNNQIELIHTETFLGLFGLVYLRLQGNQIK